MAADLDVQLHELGTHLRARMRHVGTDEVLERSAPAGDDATVRSRRSSRAVGPRRRPWWPTAVAAALVLLLAGGLLVIARRSGDTDERDGPTPLVLRDEIELRWSAELSAAGDEQALVGPLALGDDVVVVAVQGQVTALDLVDGHVRWQREYETGNAFGEIAGLTLFGDTVVFSVGSRIAGGEPDPAVVGLSVADGTEQWRVTGGQAYAVFDRRIHEYQDIETDVSFRLVDPADGSYLTESLFVATRDDVSTVGSLTIVDGDDGEPTLYDLDRRVRVPFAFPAGVDLDGTTFAPVGDDLVAVEGAEAVLYDGEGDEADHLSLPEAVHDAPWVTVFSHLGLVVVSTGDAAVGIGVDDGRLVVRWESDAAVNSIAFDPSIAIEAASPLAITAGEDFSQPGGVIDLESGELLPLGGDLPVAFVARDGYAALSAALGSDDAGTMRAYDRAGDPTWTLDVSAALDGLEQSVLGDDVLVLVSSVGRSDDGISLDVAAYG